MQALRKCTDHKTLHCMQTQRMDEGKTWIKTKTSSSAGHVDVLVIGPRRDKTCLSGFPTKRNSNLSVQLQRIARKLKFCSKHVKI